MVSGQAKAKRRVTLLVNVWLNHVPLDAIPCPVDLPHLPQPLVLDFSHPEVPSQVPLAPKARKDVTIPFKQVQKYQLEFQVGFYHKFTLNERYPLRR